MFEQPLKIASLMRDFKPDWYIAGGWAIDLFLEKETRPHQDIEIAIFRRDQLALQKYLAGWDLKKVKLGEFSDWQTDEFLELPVHEIHCFNEKSHLRSFEILLNENKGGLWLFRRNPIVEKLISEIYLTANSGFRFLSPEIVLLYKAKILKEKDERDFEAAAKFMGSESRKWLKNALLVCHPAHHWLESL